MKPLPPLLGRVRIPARFRVSSLGSLDGCRLRLVLAGTGVAPLLPSGPEALLGTVLHRLVEKAGRGLVPPDTGGPAAAAERELERLFAMKRMQLAERGESPALQALLLSPPPEWQARCKPVLRKVAARIAATPSTGTAYTSATFAGGKTRTFEDLAEGEEGYEVAVSSGTLRLEGRMDYVARRPGGEVLVRDEKTGRVLDDEGGVKPALQMQLRLYGLLVLEVLIDARVRLLIDDGEEWPVSFDEEVVEQLRSSLHRFLAGLPEGEDVPAIDVAETGDACWHCPYRPACPAYRRDAPGRWPASEKRALGPDVWGRVLGVAPGADGQLSVRIQDAAAREVRVTGVDPFHGLGLETPVGTEVAFFNLEAHWARVTRTLSGKWAHPRNFYEVPPAGVGRRAWALTVFD